ncbi:MAG: hypothetical protein AVDCRST_MAG04-1107, partial [uncultured Acetobacteraceae bacterium]
GGGEAGAVCGLDRLGVPQAARRGKLRRRRGRRLGARGRARRQREIQNRSRL